MPNNRRLNEEFPNTPVCLYRIDGHSALVNKAFIDLLGDFDLDIKGGEVTIDNGELTGMFIDVALTILEPYIPAYSSSEIKKELKLIQKELLGYGVIGVHEAGIEFEELQLLSEMVSENELDINIYAMLNQAEKIENLHWKMESTH